MFTYLEFIFFLFLHFKVTSLNFRTFGAVGSEIVLPCFNGHLGVKVIEKQLDDILNVDKSR